MGMRSTRRWRPSLLLLLLVAIACVYAALTVVSALHEPLFVSTAGSEYAGALRDDAIALDDDDDDSVDMPVFALEAAQEDAARLLDSFDEGDFLADGNEDEVGDDDDVESAVAAVEEGRSDAKEHEDASVRPVSIAFRRSDATVEDKDDEVGVRAKYEESDEQRELEQEDAAEEEDENVEHDEDPDALRDDEPSNEGVQQPTKEDDSEDEDSEQKFQRRDTTVEDADTDTGVHVEHGEVVEVQAELELKDADVEKVEIVAFVKQHGAVAGGKLDDGKLWQPAQEENAKDEDVEYESNGISKRVGAVFLKVRGVIFPNGDTKKLEDAAAKLGEGAPEYELTSPFDTELLSDVADEPVNDVIFSDYRKSTALTEQSSSFSEASRASTENEQDAKLLSDVHDGQDSGALLFSYGKPVTVFEPSLSLSEVSIASAENEEDLTSLSIDLESNDYEALEVEIHPQPVELMVSRSEETMVKVTVDTADEAEGVTDEVRAAVEEAVTVAAANTVCVADPASDPALCQSQQPEHIPVESTNNDSPTSMNSAYASIGSAVSGFQEIVLEMATAAEQMVMALRHGHRPHLPVTISEARAKVGAGVKAVVGPTRDTIFVLREYFAVAKTELGVGLEILLIHLSNLWECLKHTLSIWSHHASSAYHQISQWCWTMWNTYNEVRILGRNLLGLALLVPCGLLFFSLYRIMAAVPEFLCTYFLTFDEVTRAQLKIFSVVLVLVLVYHARVLAWFWLLLSAALGYYYWSGHVVISVKFK